MSTSRLQDQFIKCRKRGVPLIAVGTPDPAATVKGLIEAAKGNGQVRAAQWDIALGCTEPVINTTFGLAAELGGSEVAMNPVEFLVKVGHAPAKSLVFMHAADRAIRDPQVGSIVIQAIWNLRDILKARGITLVLLMVEARLPAELKNDVMVLDEPLPTAEELGKVVDALVKDTRKKYPAYSVPAEMREAAIARVAGLSAFAAEQSFAVEMTEDGIDLEGLWDRKKRVVEQTRGLSVDAGKETFDDIRGCKQIKQFCEKLFAGPEPPRVVVRMEELEKALRGTGGGDLSGTSDDALQTFLTAMEDKGWSGLIAVGHAGTGKSLLSKTMARSFGALALTLDINATKEQFVGSSEENVRSALKVIEAVGGSRVFFVASCNGVESLSAPLRRRFRNGTWMFDLPTSDERDAIWKLHRKSFSVTAKDKQPEDEGWTGAEIRNCCEMSHSLSCTLVEASQYLAPISKTCPDEIDRLRKLASGRFLSASNPGLYKFEADLPGRSMAL